MRMQTNRTIDRLLTWTQSVESKAPMEELFSALLKAFPIPTHFKIIKIAGTNGKGSVSAMLSSCLNADNQCVGMFTSPHLVNVTERFRVNEKEINEADLERLSKGLEKKLLDFVEVHGERFTPSFFDILILIAIKFFEEKKVNIAIFESGIGGAHGSISLLPDLVSVITSIGLDHCELLGNTLESIAIDKAGIAQPNSTLIVGNSINEPLQKVIKETIITKNIVFLSTKNRRSFSTSYMINEQEIVLQSSLKGRFQLQNLDLVIEIWLFLLSKKIVHRLESLQAVSVTKWNARFEIIKKKSTWILDAAHNEHAINALIISLNEISKVENRVLILGISKEKDAEKMLLLAPKIGKTVFLVDDFYKSTLNETLMNWAVNNDFDELKNSKIATAINNAAQYFAKKTIVVTGSIFMIGEARNQLLTK